MIIKQLILASRLGIISIVLLTLTALTGCELLPNLTERSATGSNKKFSGEKVGAVEEKKIQVNEQPLSGVSAETSLQSYRHIFEHSDDPEIKTRILRRMADLTMIASSDQLNDEQKKPDTEEQKPQTKNQDISYEKAIQLYKNFLGSSENIAQRAESYYQLARAYDLLGEIDRSMNMLNKLVIEHPESNYYQEAQFRRGEILFADADFSAAADAYKQVLSRKHDERFFEQSLYKYAWSLYKTEEYKVAVLAFFQLIDYMILYGNADPQALASNKLMSDSQRAISLSFSHLEGAKSVREYFETYGRKPYEINVYDALARHYLSRERFKDAADSYGTFVETHPLHPKAPIFQTAVIETYIKGSFPSQVLPAKEQFVKRFGIQSEFWSYYQARAEEWIITDKIVIDDVKKHLKQHLTDITSHYHNIAQQSGLAKDYLDSVDWYRQSLATFINDPEARNINQLLAEALFDAGDYAQAIKEFEHTVNDYPGTPEQNAKTAYFGLTAYQKLLDTFSGEESERGVWIAKKILAQLEFAKTYPLHSERANVLDLTLEDQLGIDDLLGAIETALIMVNSKNMPIHLQKKAWITIANGEFDLQQYPEAELAYLKVLEFEDHSPEAILKFKDQLATSIYKQAEGLKNAGYKLEAAEQFLRVGKQAPDSRIRATADFDAANLFLEMSSWNAAITVLTQFRRLYPNHALIETIPDKLTVAYEAVENWGAASKELEIIFNKHIEQQPALAQQALWRAAELREKSGQKSDTIRLYKQYAHGFSEPLELRAEAQYRLTNLYLEVGDFEKRQFWLKQLINNYKNAGNKHTDRSLYLAAFAAYEMSKPAFEEFANIKLKLPLKTSLQAKKQALEKSLNYYSTIIEISIADFTTAATFKTGELYRILASDLMNSEKPKGLNELELEQYEILLEEQALPFEDQAIEVYEQNTQLVLRMIYDEWVRKSFSALSKLMPGRYAKNERTETYVNEIR